MQSKKLSTSLKRKLVLSLVLGLSATPMVAVAADEDVPVYNLDEVIVTATRTQEEIKKVPSSVTVVTKEQIQKENAVTITDALKKVPGVFINRPKGIAETANGISMRGFGEDSIQVLYDGMPLNEAYDGSVNWNAIPVDNVERIEIVRGAASSLYGGRAVGGHCQRSGARCVGRGRWYRLTSSAEGTHGHPADTAQGARGDALRVKKGLRIVMVQNPRDGL